MCGGWTSHFTWKTPGEDICLDIFGIAPRGSSPWEQQVSGIYASHNVVAEMKRTSRTKDWPFATGLGGQMLMERNLDGWLHLYDIDILRRFEKSAELPERLRKQRPLLELAPFDDTLQIKRLILAEQAFWSELDEIRVRIFEHHLRPYVSAVRKASQGWRDLPVADSHVNRVECAERHLPQHPLRDHGLAKMVEEARANVAVTIDPDVLDWLPAAERNFYGL
jgi:hypothetical protein